MLVAKMDGVVAILQKANQLPTNEEGEVELDLRCAPCLAQFCCLQAFWVVAAAARAAAEQSQEVELDLRCAPCLARRSQACGCWLVQGCSQACGGWPVQSCSQACEWWLVHVRQRSSCPVSRGEVELWGIHALWHECLHDGN